MYRLFRFCSNYVKLNTGTCYLGDAFLNLFKNFIYLFEDSKVAHTAKSSLLSAPQNVFNEVNRFDIRFEN